MEVSKAAFTFFKIVEQNIQTELSNDFKNVLKYGLFQTFSFHFRLSLSSFLMIISFFYSVTGFNSAIVFNAVPDDQIPSKIEYMQNFMRTNVVKNFLRIDEQEVEEQYLKCFFGPYWKCPEKFEFAEGERILLNAIFTIIKNLVASDGLQFFQAINMKVRSSWPKSLKNSPWGNIYGNSEEQDDQKSVTDVDIDRLKEKLFKVASSSFTKYKNILQSLDNNLPTGEITKELITVKNVNGKIKGDVKCFLCSAEEEPVKIYCTETNGKLYWIASNFDSHLKRHHGPDAIKRNLPAKHVLPNIAFSSTPKRVKSESSNSFNNDNRNESIIDLQIVPLNSKLESQNTIDEVNDLHTQFTQHNIQMVNLAFTNKEPLRDFIFKENPVTKEIESVVKIRMIKGDNSCLFGSVAHQLFHVRVNSVKHIQATKELRRNVVQYITNRIPDFLQHLKDRVCSINSNFVGIVDPNEILAECSDFVENKLSSQSCWGGTESIKAISEIHKVNIILINDDGTCNFAESYDSDNERTIAIAFCNTDGTVKQNNSERNHYNSIVEIEDDLITTYVEQLIESVNSKRQLIRDIEKGEVILIDDDEEKTNHSDSKYLTKFGSISLHLLINKSDIISNVSLSKASCIKRISSMINSLFCFEVNGLFLTLRITCAKHIIVIMALGNTSKNAF